MHIPEYKIGAISTFLVQLKKLADSEGQFLYFRGHSKSSYKLEPSIFRNPGWIANESAMLKDLILRCPNDFAGGLSTFQCLVKMQHYGLPTRLLDITVNPLVALYFACETQEKEDEDGEVIVFGYGVDQVKYFDSDTVSVVANLSRQAANFTVPEAEKIDDFNDRDVIKLLLHDIRHDKPHFDPKIIRTDLSRVVCVKPLLDNPRIIRQEGAFLLFGCDRQKKQPAQVEEGVVVGRLTIDRDKKKELSDHLETLGISKATMFPEIEHVAGHIKDDYFVPSLDMGKLSHAMRTTYKVVRKIGRVTAHDVAKETKTTASSASHQIARLLELGVLETVGTGRERRWKIRENVRVTDSVKDIGTGS